MAPDVCSVPSCPRPVEDREWCHAHYMRWYTTGDVRADVPLQRHIRSGPDVQFATYVDRDGPVPEARPELGPCWLWTGKLSDAGYGYMNSAGREMPAHRWAYKRFVGPVSKGLDIDHLCRNPPCVNYEGHLELVTHRVNVLRGESPPARFARRTACSKGHPFTPENTFARADNSRGCRTCDRARSRQSYLRRKSRGAN
jgi:hypothetical protein